MNIVLFLLLTSLPLNFSKSGVSWSKCLEYGKAVYSQEDSPVLTRTPKKNNISECGIVSVPLIIGGSAASEKEFPHMAVIGFGASPSSELHWDCGGTLISESFVLTAGHCLESRQLGPAQKVRLGLTHLDKLDPSMQERVIVQKIQHPSYKPPSKANDIALLKLNEPINFTPNVRPACLNTKDLRPGTSGIATGFGKLSFDAEVGSKNLMKVSLEIYSSDNCAKVLSHKENIVDSMLCAGQMAGGKDTCQGDSGGPLQTVLENPYCMYSILGVTSFGKFCGFANSPAVYTKISTFVPWIEQIVWK